MYYAIEIVKFRKSVLRRGRGWGDSGKRENTTNHKCTKMKDQMMKYFLFYLKVFVYSILDFVI